MTWELCDSAKNVNFGQFAFSFLVVLDKFGTF